MNRSHIIGSASCSSSDLIDAKLEEHRMSGSKQCPSCGHKFNQKPDWVGLPAGVKFNPTDQELIEHLEGKVAQEESKSHPLIDEFIPTIEGEDGICYTHPEKLPGVTRDGLSKHFFHRPSKAYTTGTRKRRKIQTECDLQRGETRWHKTGKTRPVMVNGEKKGCKKILVLYTNFGKHRKPEKTNWVMHQYHLGELEEEREGELVVSKIFYQTQPRQCNSAGPSAAAGGVSNEIGGIGEHRRDSTGSGSCSSSKEVMSQREHEVGMSGYSRNMQPADNFSFAPFRKSFDEVGMGEVPTKGGDHNENEEHEQHFQRTPGHYNHHHLSCSSSSHHDHQAAAAATAAAAFQISRPTNPISAIIPPAPLHHSAVVLDDSYHVSRILLQTEKFQQQQQQQHQQQQQAQQQHHQHQHQKLVERSAAGLEELIMMGCTSADNRGQDASTIPHPQETEWLKYYWSPDNPDHHG